LPGHSPDLPAAEGAGIARLSKFVDTLADRLDRAGDSGDEPAAKSDLRKLDGVLKMIGAHHPASPATDSEATHPFPRGPAEAPRPARNRIERSGPFRK